MRPVLSLFALLATSALITVSPAQDPDKPSKFSVPKTWDDKALASLELPRADPKLKVEHVSAEYYYKIPVRRFYKSYPIYHPSKEPKPEGKDYLDWLKARKPVEILHDFSALKTKEDWLAKGPALGKDLFEAPIGDETDPGTAVARLEDVRNPAWYEKLGVLYDDDRVMPFLRYVVTDKGVRVGSFSCAMCHDRVEKLPGGKRITISGAQGNLPFDRVGSYLFRTVFLPQLGEKTALEIDTRVNRSLFGTPWLQPDPLAPFWALPLEARLVASDAIPAGVLARHGTNRLSPVQVPDLIGIKARPYLDRTGLVRHREEADLMRYASLNQSTDLLTSFGGFIPRGKDFKELPPPEKSAVELAGGRFSDEQLYALALYLHSLEPPPNPYLPKNKEQKEIVAKGEKVFHREGCARCHDPEKGYTNHKLMRAPGYTVPKNHPEKDNIMREAIDTDPFLATKTQRGTGLYKVPSLKGLWYRGPFEHNGSVATLEDWFNPKRTDPDYVPTGWKGTPGVAPFPKTRAVKGHEFGLDLSEDERGALIAFLKTL